MARKSKPSFVFRPPEGMEFAAAAAGRLCDLAIAVARHLNLSDDAHVCRDGSSGSSGAEHMDKRIVDFIQKATWLLIGQEDPPEPAITAPDAPKAKRKAKRKAKKK